MNYESGEVELSDWRYPKNVSTQGKKTNVGEIDQKISEEGVIRPNDAYSYFSSDSATGKALHVVLISSFFSFFLYTVEKEVCQVIVFVGQNRKPPFLKHTSFLTKIIFFWTKKIVFLR